MTSLQWDQVDDLIRSGIQSYKSELRQAKRPEKLPEPIPVNEMDIRPEVTRPRPPERERALATIRRETVVVTQRDHAQRVLSVIAYEFAISVAELKTGDGRRSFSVPRHIAFYLLYQVGKSLTVIGTMFGMHHTSVMYGINRVKDEMQKNPGLKAMVDHLRAQFVVPRCPSCGGPACNQASPVGREA